MTKPKCQMKGERRHGGWGDRQTRRRIERWNDGTLEWWGWKDGIMESWNHGVGRLGSEEDHS